MTPTAFRALETTTTHRPSHRPHEDRDTPAGAADPAPAASRQPCDEQAPSVAHVYAVDYLDSWDRPARDLFATAEQARARLDYLTARHRPAQLREGQDR